MTHGLKTIIYPAPDLAAAKAIFTELLGVEPTHEAPYYVGYEVAGQHIGLDPNGHRHGAVPYWHVDDIRASIKGLVDAGAQELEPVKDVGGGRQVATLKDAGGNLIGLIQG